MASDPSRRAIMKRRNETFAKRNVLVCRDKRDNPCPASQNRRFSDVNVSRFIADAPIYYSTGGPIALDDQKCLGPRFSHSPEHVTISRARRLVESSDSS